MMRRGLCRRATSWYVVLLLAVLSGVACTRSRKPASHTVTIDAARFEPAVSVVRVGDVITWTNKDLVPHTATSRTGVFDSGAIDPGKSWSYTATRAGDLPYTCTYHPTMTGLLQVK
jgi:plastocyanin